MARRLRIAWFSPLYIEGEITESKGAYLSDKLVPLIEEEFEIEFFYDGFDYYYDYPTYHYLRAAKRHEQDPFDLFFYQLEDGPAANFVRMHLALKPGVVLFHDFLFSSFGPEPILNSPWQHIARKFSDDSLPWPTRGGEFDQEGPVGFREASYAPLALFSQPAHHAEYKRLISKKIETLGSHYLPLPIDINIERGSSGLRTVCYCGSPRIEHRSHKVLQALSEIKEPFQFIWSVSKAEEAEAEELLREFSIQNTELLSNRNPDSWREVLKRSDIAIHTHFSVFAGISPYFEMSMMAGLPCVVTRFGGMEFLPDDLVIRVQPGETESVEIGAAVKELLSGSVKIPSERIQDFAREVFDRRMVAQELSTIFNNSYEFFARFNSKWNSFEGEARGSLLNEALNIVPDDCDSDVNARKMLGSVYQELGWK